MINQDDQIDGLTDNACRFLGRAADDLKNDEIAFSVIHFYTAIELILKARLVAEHWSLVLKDPGTADVDKFIKGDVQTVGLSQSISRIRKIIKFHISQSSEEVFDKLRKSRNQLVHFHGAEWPKSKWSTQPESVKAKEDAISLQCRAWLDLHQLLTVHWRMIFARKQSNIQQIETSMVGIRKYLQVKYERLKPDLDTVEDGGRLPQECPSCGFRALFSSEPRPDLHVESCRVCGFYDCHLDLPCKNVACEGTIQVHESGPLPCSKCCHQLSIDDIADRLTPWFDMKDGGEPDRAFCGECNSYEISDGTVVPSLDASYYICLSCLQDFNAGDIATCEWCGVRFTGNAEGTYLGGCEMCDGRLGHGD